MPVAYLKSRCFVNAPFLYLQENLSNFVHEGIQPEIGFEGNILYTADEKDFATVAQTLAAHNLSCTLHAPFFELYPGSLDPEIRRVSRRKIRKAFDLIPLFKPKSIVCHLGFEENKHGYKTKEWFKYSLEAWQEFLAVATEHDTPFMLENTYEQGPEHHQQVLQALDSPYARFCLDVGHVLAFAKKDWHDWLPALETWLGQLHLHDNHGGRDTHLAIGQGIFDFAGLFAYLKEKRLSPLITLEPHHENGLMECLNALDKLNIFPDTRHCRTPSV